VEAAAADAFVSANLKWMDYGARSDHLSGGGDRERQARDDPISGVSALCEAKSIFEGYGFSVLAKPTSWNQRVIEDFVDVRYWHKADIPHRVSNVRFCGGKADIRRASLNVRFWPKADMSGSGLPPCKLTPEPNFAGRKTLLRADRMRLG
jgi:hypothetical protein